MDERGDEGDVDYDGDDNDGGIDDGDAVGGIDDDDGGGFSEEDGDGGGGVGGCGDEKEKADNKMQRRCMYMFMVSVRSVALNNIKQPMYLHFETTTPISFVTLLSGRHTLCTCNLKVSEPSLRLSNILHQLNL